jgi:hypothetical protein
LRNRGVVCAITSGLACVHYGLAETTKDCDLLCHTGAFAELLTLLADTRIDGIACQYRGNISPPLDAKWHQGGWTSHFEWLTKPMPAKLDVFGHALRESSPWTEELFGLYASPHTVADMKKTDRGKDWDFVTGLGVRMIEADDERGWLHIFNGDTLCDLIEGREIPANLAEARPALRFALERDRRMDAAIRGEQMFWEELDRRRIQILERVLRPYVSAVRKARFGRQLSLRDDHHVRIECANCCLPANPLKEYGLQHYIQEARARLPDLGLIPDALTWLPDVTKYFEWLNK